jgi:hypothetical protein
MVVRKFKQQIRALLECGDFPEGLQTILGLPARQVVNPLFSCFYDLDEMVRWRAVVAMGQVVAKLAESDMESARVVMRRLLWNLNDESGGIGWGSPEAMGEIMAQNARLAGEYARMLVSYVRPDGNFLEHEGLQQGLLWALGRLARVQRHLVADAAEFLVPFFRSEQAALRGLSAWAGHGFKDPDLAAHLVPLVADPAPVQVFVDGRFLLTTVGKLAQDAINGLEGGQQNEMVS